MAKNQQLFQDLDEVQQLFTLKSKDLALRKIDKIIKRHDSHYLPYNYRGIIFLASEKYDLALKDFKKSISLNKEFSEGYCNLGNTYQALNNYEKSIEAYLYAFEINPKNLQVKLNIGMLYFKMREYKKAVDTYQSVLNIDNRIEYAHHLIADAFIQDSKHRESLAHHEEALTLNPHNALNYFLIGRDHLWKGEKKLAVEYLKKSLEINPRDCPTYFALSKLESFGLANKIVNDITILLQENISALEKAYLNFAMGKIFEDHKDFEKSFNYLSIGNKFMKEHNKFEITKYEKEMIGAIDFYEEKVQRLNLSEKNIDNEITPIFILGMPRSGSSLIEQVLSNHPKVFGAGELDTIDYSFNRLIKDENLNEKMVANAFYAIRERYIKRLKNISDKPFVIDKLPLNFFWIGYVKKLFPNAKIIHTIRDPIATSFSIFKTLFSNGSLNFAYDQDDIIGFYKIYLKFLNFWDTKFTGEILNVQYDSFVINSEQEAKVIFDYIGLEYSSDYLMLQNNHRLVMTASDLQVRDKIYKGSSETWINYKKFLEKFQKAL
jgi:tetratricopeptide (TPR) repeat protein